MKNTILTYTAKNMTITKLVTWAEANQIAKNIIALADVDNVVATWYDMETGAPLLKREYILGCDYFTGEDVLCVKDNDYPEA